MGLVYQFAAPLAGALCASLTVVAAAGYAVKLGLLALAGWWLARGDGPAAS